MGLRRILLLLPFGASGCFLSNTPAEGEPSAPRDLTAVRGDEQVWLAWTDPKSQGTSRLEGFTLTIEVAGVVVGSYPDLSAGTHSFEATGLTNGTPHTFAVRARNDVGDGPPATIAVTPATIPSAPASLEAERGDARVDLFWMAPVSDGGDAITGYTVTVFEGATVVQPPAAVGPGTLTLGVVGLENGADFHFEVHASNGIGDGPSASIDMIPGTMPSPPLALTATRGDEHVFLDWNPPASDGGLGIGGYEITVLDGQVPVGMPVQVGASITEYDATSLVNGTTYTFEVLAFNVVGDGDVASIAAIPATVPTPPADLDAERGNQNVVVTWMVSTTDGGSAITGYTIRVFDDGTPVGTPVSVNASTFMLDVTGLVNGTEYTLEVVATNAVGDSAPAVISATPATFPSAPSALSIRRHPARVFWTPGADGGAPITGYQLRAIPMIGDTSGSPTFIVPGPSSGSFPNLPDLDEFALEVTAINDVGASASVLGPGSVVTGCSVTDIKAIRAGAYGLVVEDFDKDGTRDVAVSGGGNVNIYDGLGDGLFVRKQTISSPASSVNSAITAFDRTSDGTADLVLATATGSGGASRGLLGAPDGTFTLEAGSGTLATAPTSITHGDFDGNGSQEVVFGGETATGPFGALPPEGVGSKFVSSADLDGDGFDDLLVVNVETIVEVRWGGMAMPLSTSDAFVLGGQGVDVAAADFDEDGLLDIVSANQHSGGLASVSHLRQTAARTFGAPMPLPLALASANHLAIADFDGDGHQDIAISDTKGFQILLGDGNGGFLLLGPFGFPSPTFQSLNYYRMAAADIDNDARLDIVIGNPDASRVYGFRGNGDGTFPSIPTYTTAVNAQSVLTGLFDADARPDVVAFDPNTNTLNVFTGNSGGGLTAGGNFPVGVGGHYGAVADFDEDGELDLAVAGNGGLRILLGNGDGTFDAPLSAATGDQGRVLVTDVNDDTHVDLVVERVAAGNTAILLLTGDGNGGFTTSTLLSPASGLALADLGGDGDVDVLSSTLSVPVALMGDGNGGFVQTAITSSCRPRVAGDLDFDGLPDLVGRTLGGINGSIDVCYGISATEFSAPVSVTVLDSDPHTLVDFDGDGLLDILADTDSAAGANLLLNDGARGFALVPLLAGGVKLPAVADFTGDGVLDIVSVDSDGLRVWRQPCVD